MKGSKNLMKVLGLLSMIGFLGACVGEEPVTKSFSVTLKTVEVKRLSNGESVAVDTAGVTSGPLTLETVAMTTTDPSQP